MSYYNQSDSAVEGCASCLVFLIIYLIIVFVGGLVSQLLWNWLAPQFWEGAPILTYWQAVGVCALLSIIGGFFRR